MLSIIFTTVTVVVALVVMIAATIITFVTLMSEGKHSRKDLVHGTALSPMIHPSKSPSEQRSLVLKHEEFKQRQSQLKSEYGM